MGVGSGERSGYRGGYLIYYMLVIVPLTPGLPAKEHVTYLPA